MGDDDHRFVRILLLDHLAGTLSERKGFGEELSHRIREIQGNQVDAESLLLQNRIVVAVRALILLDTVAEDRAVQLGDLAPFEPTRT